MQTVRLMDVCSNSRSATEQQEQPQQPQQHANNHEKGCEIRQHSQRGFFSSECETVATVCVIVIHNPSGPAFVVVVFISKRLNLTTTCTNAETLAHYCFLLSTLTISSPWHLGRLRVKGERSWAAVAEFASR